MGKHIPSIRDQAAYWDKWNTVSREGRSVETSQRQWEAIEAFLRSRGRRNLEIIDIGCGTGWACERLRDFGRVTGVDFAQSVIDRARQRLPDVRFECGDFFRLDLARSGFDLAVSLEVLSHVEDQQKFVTRCATLLRPGGFLLLCIQNRTVLERWDDVAPADPHQIRHWLNQRELKALLTGPFDIVSVESLFPVGNRGVLRWVNSPKLNLLASSVLGGQDRVTRLKEKAGLGHTLLAIARRT